MKCTFCGKDTSGVVMRGRKAPVCRAHSDLFRQVIDAIEEWYDEVKEERENAASRN